MAAGKMLKLLDGGGDGGEVSSDLCGFVCFVIGVVSMFLIVGAIATLIVLGVDDRQQITSLTSTHPAKSLTSGVKALLQDYPSMQTRVIDNTRTTPTKKLDLLVLVRSLKQSAHTRDIIRKTWKKTQPPGVEVVFVVPAALLTPSQQESLEEESNRHRDMVVFLDAPVVPESESFLVGLAWAMHTRQFAYLMSTRDSMYVRLDLLAEEVILKLLDNRSNAYVGYFEGRQSPWSETSTKLAEPTWFMCDNFIRFAHSGGYILSHNLVQRLHSQATVLYPYNNEDVAVGTWLFPYDDITWVHNVRFDTEVGRSRGCHNHWIIFPSSAMESVHSRLTSGEPACILEHDMIPTYTYNFFTAPSKCCNNIVNFHRR